MEKSESTGNHKNKMDNLYKNGKYKIDNFYKNGKYNNEVDLFVSFFAKSKDDIVYQNSRYLNSKKAKNRKFCMEKIY